MNRREFFRRSGLGAAVPALGVAKVIGVKPAVVAPTTFVTGGILTAAVLNAEFQKLHDLVRAVS